jgi:serine/threonine protein kinase
MAAPKRAGGSAMSSRAHHPADPDPEFGLPRAVSSEVVSSDSSEEVSPEAVSSGAVSSEAVSSEALSSAESRTEKDLEVSPSELSSLEVSSSELLEVSSSELALSLEVPASELASAEESESVLSAAGELTASKQSAPAADARDPERRVTPVVAAAEGRLSAEVARIETPGSEPLDSESPDSEAEVSEADLVEAELASEGSSEGQSSEQRMAMPSPRATGASESRLDPPWVDEQPDPVTPYEQRVSETVKVADLPPVEQLRGRVLANRYLAEEVAEQTLASVSYRSYHLALDRAVTVRILPRGLACSDEACQEVRRIANAATALKHPNIAATLDFGVLSDGWPFVVTEHFQGKTLALLVAQEGKFVLRRVLHIGKQLAAGLSAAHAAGLVHGLFNPDNVLVVEPGTSAEVAMILGFGISSARGPAPGPPRSGVFGVPFYVSPEQAGCRPLDARSDLYSLGIILYELMTGAPPFSDGDFAGVLCQHLDDDAVPPSSRLRAPGALAKAMDAIVQRCLRKDPSKRYQTAAELGEDLVRLEAAAARSKRRPMPEVKRPTTTIHSPAPKAESTAPGAKVIVHGDADEPRSSPSRPTSSPSPARQASGFPTGRMSVAPAGMTPGSLASGKAPSTPPVAGAGKSSRPPASVARPEVSRAPRVRVDQATIRISAGDRALILGQRPRAGTAPAGAPPRAGVLTAVLAVLLWFRAVGSWLAGVLHRLVASTTRDDDSRG